MAPELKKEIEALLSKARKKIASAKVESNSGFYDDAISRAYYAVFHGAQALLLSKGMRARSHKGLLNLFGLHFVQPGVIEREYAMTLNELRNSRENSDYDVFIEFTLVEAEAAISRSEKFLSRIEAILKIS